MHVNTQSRTVFLHNPKTAGLSIGSWLVDYHGYVPVDVDPDALIEDDEGGRIWLHNWKVPAEFAGFTTWCVVRNPFTRWVSFCRFSQLYNLIPADMDFERITQDCIMWLPCQAMYTRSCQWYARFENLQQSLSDRGFAHVDKLPLINVTGGTAVWTEASKQRIIENYWEDFGTLGYQFEPPVIQFTQQDQSCK